MRLQDDTGKGRLGDAQVSREASHCAEQKAIRCAWAGHGGLPLDLSLCLLFSFFKDNKGLLCP